MSAGKETATASTEYLARTEAIWVERFANYDPTRLRATWSSSWGPPPDSPTRHPSRPHLQEAWRARNQRRPL
jgi:hypothetical protein